jgi:hypothetical protein
MQNKPYNVSLAVISLEDIRNLALPVFTGFGLELLFGYWTTHVILESKVKK